MSKTSKASSLYAQVQSSLADPNYPVGKRAHLTAYTLRPTKTLSDAPKKNWEPKARWVRTDLSLPSSADSSGGSGSEHIVKLWTTSGVSAGTDGIFALIEEEYGADVAEFTAEILEYERKTDPNDDPFAVRLE